MPDISSKAKRLMIIWCFLHFSVTLLVFSPRPNLLLGDRRVPGVIDRLDVLRAVVPLDAVAVVHVLLREVVQNRLDRLVERVALDDREQPVMRDVDVLCPGVGVCGRCSVDRQRS